MTAEFAVTVPAVLLVLAACLGGLRFGAERLRVVDAAAQAARSAAVGEPAAVPAGAIGALVVAQRRTGETVCVTIRKDVTVLAAPLRIEETGCSLAGVLP